MTCGKPKKFLSKGIIIVIIFSYKDTFTYRVPNSFLLTSIKTVT